MALPVAQIMAQLQGRGRGGDEDEEGMVDDVASEELEVVDDQGEGQEEQNGHIEDTELEIIEGERAGTKWLVINQVHICYKLNSKETKKSVTWECSGRRRLGCPFKIVTTKAEGSEDILILKMSDPEVHTCSAEKTGPLMQKFLCRPDICFGIFCEISALFFVHLPPHFV